MSNYIPKEKKPVLNEQTINKDLKYQFASPIMWRISLFILFLIFIAITVGSFFGFSTMSGLSLIPYSFMVLCFVLITIFLGGMLAHFMAIPLAIKHKKYSVLPDTIDHKVAREKVRDWTNVKEHNGDRYRYPCVLYFKKYGRFEICDSETHYGEYDSLLENSIEKLLDSYELDKTYYVVTFGKKNKILKVYDPDKYDVQL